MNRVDTTGVNLDVINRYRWPTLVRYWDRCVVGQQGLDFTRDMVEEVDSFL